MCTALKCLALLALVLFPATVFAQGSLTGTCRHASGGVLPGVTVEAASPALIEKVRTAVTDAGGQYRIVDLRPGVYALTFALPGFSTVVRDKIELTGSQTLTIPIEMRVGGLEETITVTGETPWSTSRTPRGRCDDQRGHRETPRDASCRSAAQCDARHHRWRGRRGAVADHDLLQRAFQHHNSTSVAGEGRYAINGFPLTAARSGGFASVVYDTVTLKKSRSPWAAALARAILAAR